jgi:plastocyanin
MQQLLDSLGLAIHNKTISVKDTKGSNMPKDSFKLNPFGRTRNRSLFLAVAGVASVVALVGVIIFSTQQSATSLASRKTIIQVTANGFIPATVAVKAGTQIVWQNTDSAPHVVASNPYPQNSSVPGLHSQTILPNGSYTYKTTTDGTIEYHDNTQPTVSGVIKVGQK